MIIDTLCPSCRHADCVQSVPAVCASGTSTVYDHGYFTGVGAGPPGIVSVMGSSLVERTESSLLAQALAPEPEFRSAGRLTAIALVMAIPSAISLLMGATAFLFPHPEISTASVATASLVLALLLGAPALLVLWFAFRRLRRSRRIRLGRPAAYAVWRAGVYCHRCGTCFWPCPTAPDVPVGQPVPPGAFQWIVWNTGGYVNDA